MQIITQSYVFTIYYKWHDVDDVLLTLESQVDTTYNRSRQPFVNCVPT